MTIRPAKIEEVENIQKLNTAIIFYKQQGYQEIDIALEKEI